MPFFLGFLIVSLDDYGPRDSGEIIAFASVIAFIVAIGGLLIGLAGRVE